MSISRLATFDTKIQFSPQIPKQVKKYTKLRKAYKSNVKSVTFSCFPKKWGIRSATVKLQDQNRNSLWHFLELVKDNQRDELG